MSLNLSLCCLFVLKNLASVSATPGHTQAFHFFTLQMRPHQTIPLMPTTALQQYPRLLGDDVQGVRIVDIPGLGYAETVDSDKQQSWKSLIMRYLSVRDSNKVVLHLVDSRHELSSTDHEVCPP